MSVTMFIAIFVMGIAVGAGMFRLVVVVMTVGV